jgi:hypothetical protein
MKIRAPDSEKKEIFREKLSVTKRIAKRFSKDCARRVSHVLLRMGIPSIGLGWRGKHAADQSESILRGAVFP